jgi:hypothetical protein
MGEKDFIDILQERSDAARLHPDVVYSNTHLTLTSYSHYDFAENEENTYGNFTDHRDRPSSP